MICALPKFARCTTETVRSCVRVHNYVFDMNDLLGLVQPAPSMGGGGGGDEGSAQCHCISV